MFARALTGLNVKDLLTKVGSSAAAAPAPAAAAPAAAAGKKEEKKEEKKKVEEEEEDKEDEDMGFGKNIIIFSVYFVCLILVYLVMRSNISIYDFSLNTAIQKVHCFSCKIYCCNSNIKYR